MAVQFMPAEKWALVGQIVGVNNFNGRHGDDPFSVISGLIALSRPNILGGRIADRRE
jgi:hypothetical protein